MGERGRRCSGAASPREGLGALSQSTGRRRLIPRFPSLASLRALRVSVHSSSKLARCRIRQLLLRISTDSPSISPTIPPCYSLRRQRSARGCSATRHWDLGPLQALASLQYRTKLEPCSKGRPRRAEPTHHGGVCSSSPSGSESDYRLLATGRIISAKLELCAHSAVRASFAHHYVPRAGRRACAPRQWQ